MGLPNSFLQKTLRNWFFLIFATSATCRRLTAVSKHPTLLPRGSAFRATHFGQTLFYADGASDAHADEAVYAAKLTLNTTHPAVVLDDYMERLEDVRCSSHHMVITFRGLDNMALAEEAWGTEFLVITSIEACAAVGHHQPYKASNALYDHHSQTATLWAKPVEMKDCTHRVHVEFGYDTGYIKPRLEKRLPNPQGSGPETITTTPATSSDIQIATMTPTVTFSYPSDTVTPSTTAREASKTIDFSYINQGLIPPDFAGEGYLPSYPDLNDIALSCTNCTMAGEVELIAGGFDVGLEKYHQIVDFLENGYLEFSLNGLRAHMGLELSFLPGFTLTQFNVGLPPIPIAGLDIAGILQIGPLFSPAIPINVVLDSTVNLTFGLALSGPDIASVVLDFGNITNLTSTGIDQFDISLLPFNYTAQNLSLNLSAALQPQLSLGAASADPAVTVSGGAGVYLNLPILTAEILHLSNLTANCTAPAPVAGSHAAAPLYESLLNIIPSVQFGTGLSWNAEADVGPLDFGWARQGGVGLPVLSRPLPTTCLAFDRRGALVNASSTAAAKSGAAAEMARTANMGVMWGGVVLAVAVVEWAVVL